MLLFGGIARGPVWAHVGERAAERACDALVEWRVVNRLRVIAIVASGGVLGGCTLLTSLDGLSSDAAGSDATAPASEAGSDGATARDAGSGDTGADGSGLDGGTRDAAPDAPSPVNLAPNPGLETGKPDCAPWGGYESTLVSESPGRSGALACRVCAKPDVPFFTIDGDVLTAPPIGSRYRAEAWVRAIGTTKPATVDLHLRTYNTVGGFVDRDQAVSSEIQIGTQWAKLEVEMTVTKTAERLDVFVAGGPPVGAGTPCFLVDDILVVSEN